MAVSDIVLTPRWTPLEYNEVQQAAWHPPTRFSCNSSGRRAGKSEGEKRNLIISAIEFTAFPDGWFTYCAPTYSQVKNIAWEDLKQLSPPSLVTKISESELFIQFVNGAKVQCLGMDKAMRSEGSAMDGCVMDEYGDMKAEAFGASIRPALSTRGRPGWCHFIGKPRGRNHWYKLCKSAATKKNWSHFSIPSWEIIGREEAESAKDDMDMATWRQEYGAEFLETEGRAYHEFSEESHCKPVFYKKGLPLRFAFDFNVAPGVAVVSQEYDNATNAIGEVWIPEASNTKLVCKALIGQWRNHDGKVILYGDATGGARGTAKVEGSDWELIQRYMALAIQRRAVKWTSVEFRVPKSNPLQVARLNAVNSRLRTANGKKRAFVNRERCPHLVDDLCDVQRADDGTIDKKHDAHLTHISDAWGYQIAFDHPIQGRVTTHSALNF